MKVYHGYHDDMKFLTEVATMEEAMQFVVKDIDNKKYGGYYQRWYTLEGTTYVDYGSHTQFYFIKED